MGRCWKEKLCFCPVAKARTHVMSGRFLSAISMVERSRADFHLLPIHLHTHPQGKHSACCTNKHDAFQKATAFLVCPLDDGLALSVRLGLDLQGLQAVRTKLRTRRAFRIPLSRSHPMLLIPLCSFIVLIEALESQKGEGDNTPSSA